MNNPKNAFNMLSNKFRILNGFFKLVLYAKKYRDLLIPENLILMNKSLRQIYKTLEKQEM